MKDEERMDKVLGEHLRSQLRGLEIDGGNLISGGGPPEALRLRYLNFRDEVERLLTDSSHQVRVDLHQLQSPRHRDLVSDRVVGNQVYREVAAEVRTALSVLAEFGKELEKALAHTSAVDPDEVRFVAEAGREYRFSRSDRLGQPGAFGSVYRGTGSTGDVAIKEVLLRSREDALQAEREVDIGQRLSGGTAEYFVPLLDVGRRDNALLLVMPVAVESLADRIKRGPPTVRPR
ncbi:hypothetical protein [Dactylosporangium salmoneum]|uniref:Protein kinase domain-containing protein n=1 Tax=Dactylosporangium salmoneum TaxID=53361 RepID=A0ABP5TGD8_9ACTN